MPRLPIVGSDNNTWGTVLNSYLQTTPFFNVQTYGAAGDGITDNTSAINAAITAVVAAGGGVLFFPPGTYLSGNLDFSGCTGVLFLGAFKHATVIKLMNGANADLFSAQTSSINLSAAGGSGAAGSLYNFGFMNMTLDGNKANQTGGPSYPLRFYGYSYILQNLEVRNGYSGGILSDWNAGNTVATNADGMEAQWINVKAHDNGGVDAQIGGPHDSQFTNCKFFKNSPGSGPTHNFHLAPNASGAQCTNVHAWGPGAGAVAILVECFISFFVNCEAESSDTIQLALIGGNCHWFGGLVFSTYGTPTGIKIGQQASETPLAGQILQSAGVTTASASNRNKINTAIDDCTGTHGALWLDNDGGNNFIDLSIKMTGGTNITGTPDPSSTYRINNVQSWGVSGTAPDPGNGGTITTAGQTVARIIPIANETGVILQAGTLPGQKCTVMNKSSSYSVTFAASGTSHVADGVSDVVAANSAATYTYDTGSGFWYRG